MFRTFLAVAWLAVVSGTCVAQDDSKIVPKGLAPELYTLTKIDADNITFARPLLTKDGRAYEGGFTALKDIDIYDGSGKKLTPDDFRKRVKVGTVLVVAPDSDKPAPAYFRVLKEDTVVLVGALLKVGTAPKTPKK